MTKCTLSNLFCPLLTWIALLWTTTQNLNHELPALTHWKGNKTSSHGANSIRYTVDTSLVKHTLSIPSLCAFRQGITILDGGGRRGGEEEKRGLWEELWRSFIVHHKGGKVLPWTWTETKDAMICLQKCLRDRGSINSAVPDTPRRKWWSWNDKARI